MCPVFIQPIQQMNCEGLKLNELSVFFCTTLEHFPAVSVPLQPLPAAVSGSPQSVQYTNAKWAAKCGWARLPHMHYPRANEAVVLFLKAEKWGGGLSQCWQSWEWGMGGRWGMRRRLWVHDGTSRSADKHPPGWGVWHVGWRKGLQGEGLQRCKVIST